MKYWIYQALVVHGLVTPERKSPRWLTISIARGMVMVEADIAHHICDTRAYCFLFKIPLCDEQYH